MMCGRVQTSFANGSVPLMCYNPVRNLDFEVNKNQIEQRWS